MSYKSDANSSDKYMKVPEAMARLRYKDPKSFLGMARSRGLPLTYLNARVIRIRRADFASWLKRRGTS